MMDTYTFPKLQKKDFDKVMGILDVPNTATYSLLLNHKRVSKTSQEIFNDKYAKIGDRTYSGKQREGSAPANAEKSTYEYVENACEIFKKTAKATATAIAVAKANGENIIKNELQYSLIAIKKDINHAIVVGELSKTDPRATAGFKNLVAEENTFEVEGELTKAIIDNMVLKVSKVAKGQLFLAVSSADLPTLQELLLQGKTINVNDGGDAIAGVAVTKYKSVYGPVVNIYCEDELSTGEVLVYDIASVGIRVLRDFFQKDNAKDFDGELSEIITELGATGNPQAIALAKPQV
ncbi:hypothetical protein B5E87_00200 [Massilimicrobiota sp. An142]|uniref:SU10 major capsid protein n=1 Tax=Massilimicrobiota sp. An142 TaxID=1965564 RepID=UPI000B385DE5|nr:DUF5309 family protein [Massilimicrobiota sp. An142]OUQ15027.1 hypothetical protein B5E87_00200 [Massilimicrobiota sp. An142]